MKRRVLTGICVMMLIMACSLGVSAASFSDINGHWAQQNIEIWTENGIIRGYTDGTFKPNNPITRGEMATLIDRLLKFETMAANVFGDLDNGFYHDPMLKANAAQIFLGDADMRMRPNEYISRQEAATVLGRAFGVELSDSATPPSFTDYHSIAPWAIDYVREMNAKGYVSGRTDGSFDPTASITRGEVVRILSNICEGYYDEAGEYTGDINGTAVINTSDVTIRNATITGDLIIAEGVADGDIVLDNVIVYGEMFVRGGGENSVVVKGASSIAAVDMGRTAGTVRLNLVKPAYVRELTIAERSADVIINGTVHTLNIESPTARVSAYEAELGQVNLLSQNSDFYMNNLSEATAINIAEGANSSVVEMRGRVGSVVIAADSTELTVHGVASSVTTMPTANDTDINAYLGGGISTIDTSGTNTVIHGDGRVEVVFVRGNTTTVDTKGTNLSVSSLVTGTLAGDTKVAGGHSAYVDGKLPAVKDPVTGEYSSSALTKLTITPSITYVMEDAEPVTFTADVTTGIMGMEEVVVWESTNETVGMIRSQEGASMKADFYPLSLGTTQIKAIAFDGTTAVLEISVIPDGGVCMIGDTPFDTLQDAIDSADLSNTDTTIKLMPAFYEIEGMVEITPTTNNSDIKIEGLGRNSDEVFEGSFEITRPNVTLTEMNMAISAVEDAAKVQFAQVNIAPNVVLSAAHMAGDGVSAIYNKLGMTPAGTASLSSVGTASTIGDFAAIIIDADNVNIISNTIEIGASTSDFAIYGIFVDEASNPNSSLSNVQIQFNEILATNSGEGDLAYAVYSRSPLVRITSNTVESYRGIGVERLTQAPNINHNTVVGEEYDFVYHGLANYIASEDPEDFATIYGGDKNLNLASQNLLNATQGQLYGSKKVLLAQGTTYNTWLEFEYFDYSKTPHESFYYNRGTETTWELTDLAVFMAARAVLEQTITDSLGVYNSATTGTAIDQFPDPAKPIFDTEIKTATAILANAKLDPPTVTTTEVNDANNTIATALATFENKQVKPSLAKDLFPNAQTLRSGDQITLAYAPKVGETVWFAPAGSTIHDLNELDGIGETAYAFNRNSLTGNAVISTFSVPIMPGDYKLFVVYDKGAEIYGVASSSNLKVEKAIYPLDGIYAPKIPAISTTQPPTDSVIAITAPSLPQTVPPMNYTPTYEYAISKSPDASMLSNEWGTSLVFTGLDRDTQYYVFSRVATTKTHEASNASTPVAVRTEKTVITGITHPSPTFDLVNGEILKTPTGLDITTSPSSESISPTSITITAGGLNQVIGTDLAVSGTTYTFTVTYAVPQGFEFALAIAGPTPPTTMTVNSNSMVTYTYSVLAP